MGNNLTFVYCQRSKGSSAILGERRSEVRQTPQGRLASLGEIRLEPQPLRSVLYEFQQCSPLESEASSRGRTDRSSPPPRVQTSRMRSRRCSSSSYTYLVAAHVSRIRAFFSGTSHCTATRRPTERYCRVWSTGLHSDTIIRTVELAFGLAQLFCLLSLSLLQHSRTQTASAPARGGQRRDPFSPPSRSLLSSSPASSRQGLSRTSLCTRRSSTASHTQLSARSDDTTSSGRHYYTALSTLTNSGRARHRHPTWPCWRSTPCCTRCGHRRPRSPTRSPPPHPPSTQRRATSRSRRRCGTGRSMHC